MLTTSINGLCWYNVRNATDLMLAAAEAMSQRGEVVTGPLTFRGPSFYTFVRGNTGFFDVIARDYCNAVKDQLARMIRDEEAIIQRLVDGTEGSCVPVQRAAAKRAFDRLIEERQDEMKTVARLADLLEFL